MQTLSGILLVAVLIHLLWTTDEVPQGVLTALAGVGIVVLVLGLLGGAVVLYYAFFTPPTYTAPLPWTGSH